MYFSRKRLVKLIWAGAVLPLLSSAALGQAQSTTGLEPEFAIWDVQLGESVSQIPEIDVIEVTCGTNGGPGSLPIQEFEAFAQCPPEPGGLREVNFGYDDETDYIAKAMDAEYEILQDGTSVFSHPVMLSVLVDEEGIIRGIRILTDPRVPERERRLAITLIRNFKAKYGEWNLECTDLPRAEGENPVGSIFMKEQCFGESPDGTRTIRLDGHYLRKKGQEAVNRETREVNSDYFESYTRLEIVEKPFETNELTTLAQ